MYQARKREKYWIVRRVLSRPTWVVLVVVDVDVDVDVDGGDKEIYY